MNGKRELNKTSRAKNKFKKSFSILSYNFDYNHSRSHSPLAEGAAEEAAGVDGMWSKSNEKSRKNKTNNI